MAPGFHNRLVSRFVWRRKQKSDTIHFWTLHRFLSQFFSFVLGATGALHSLTTEAPCDDPSWFDDFLALSSSNAPHIAHKRHWTDFSRIRV